MKRLPHVTLVLLVPLLTAAQKNNTEEPAPDRVDVVAEVVEFTPQAIWEHYTDGGFACFSATQLVLRAPVELAGKKLRVIHDEPDLPQDSPWRTVGRQLSFSIEAKRLQNALAGEVPSGHGETYTTWWLFSGGMDLEKPEPQLQHCRAPHRRRFRGCLFLAVKKNWFAKSRRVNPALGRGLRPARRSSFISRCRLIAASGSDQGPRSSKPYPGLSSTTGRCR